MNGVPRRYVLHPGFVRSRNDGERHWISFDRLAELYHLPLHDCSAYVSPAEEASGVIEVIHLFPRDNGDYSLPPATSRSGRDRR